MPHAPPPLSAPGMHLPDSHWTGLFTCVRDRSGSRAVLLTVLVNSCLLLNNEQKKRLLKFVERCFNANHGMFTLYAEGAATHYYLDLRTRS